MPKIKVNEASGVVLDWLVAKCENRVNIHFITQWEQGHRNYSTNWSQGGPIIEREKISIVCAEGDYNQSKAGTPDCYDTYWVAEKGRQCLAESFGPQGDDWGTSFRIEDSAHSHAPLSAAMRCYVASKLGDEVEVPEGLK